MLYLSHQGAVFHERKTSTPTQEERITFLEHTTREYRPVLKDISYEMTMVKGLIVEQTVITQELRRDMDDIKVRLTRVEDRMTRMEDRMMRMEEKLDTILTLLKPS